MHTERPESLEEIVCVHQLKVLREQAAAGNYVRPQILEKGTTELIGRLHLNSEQGKRLEELWKRFVRDIKAARLFLNKYTSKVADALAEATTTETGEYKPDSSAQAAQVGILVVLYIHTYNSNLISLIIKNCFTLFLVKFKKKFKISVAVFFSFFFFAEFPFRFRHRQCI
jgi:hypothetical protein